MKNNGSQHKQNCRKIVSHHKTELPVVLKAAEVVAGLKSLTFTFL